MQITKKGDGYCFGQFTVNDAGGPLVFRVLFIKDENGIWRIKNF